MARQTDQGKQQQRPPRASVPAFGGWEGGALPDYSVDFTKIRAARMQRRRKALSWSSFVGNAAIANAAAAEAPGADEDRDRRHWSSAASDGGDDDRERRHRHRPRHRRLRSDAADLDDRQPIRPGRADPKGRGKFKGYLFGCVGGLW
ncbi:hypothetical protein SEVIR_8G190300v4 [Setaria viridis]|uniref:RIN4 pathogenic type III effector avirulence factor Avr cleavage site domain-containing protein n=2 Tax=Setaria TaxID=4554 RepID=K3ZLK5_SETIT|nr:uncharacterized protein LOC101762266 [Setaria italica]XP_034569375.1 uncharacterized protein LOC117833887 [Setaria viridis]RCV38920.1 hypothetical protein SETIT_8G181100v2 [Setaria italica]TKW01578.1 hypothetical protein SEVIR_8G190300v2 [Setaria viridis]